MKRFYLVVLVVLLSGACIRARQNQSGTLISETKQGEMLFEQRCFICHDNAGGLNYAGGIRGRYGPQLSKGNITSEAYVRKQIMEGGKRMPGFKYILQPSQVSSIIAYLKTIDSSH